MSIRLRRKSEALPLLGAFAVLLACLYYLALLHRSPSPAQLWDSSTWEVVRTLDPCSEESCLRPGDRLVSIGGVSFEDFRANRHLAIFENPPPYQVVFEREGRRFETTLEKRRADLLGLLDVGAKSAFVLLFWLAGTLVLALVRPRDERWLMLGLFCHLAALFFAAGFVSYTHLAFASSVTRVTGAFFLPVALHVHFLLPEPRWPRLKQALLPSLYALAVAMLVVDFFEPMDARLFFLAPTVGIAGSLVLLTGHLRGPQAPTASRASRLMVTGIFLGTVPILLATLVLMIGQAHVASPRATITFQAVAISLALPNWPLAYLLALRQAHSFPWEIRANRTLGTYGFWSIYLLVYFAAFTLSAPHLRDQALIGGFLLACPFLLAAPKAQNFFQRLLDRRILGIHHTPVEVVSLFAQKIPVAFERPQLVALITEQILPTLLIRRSALILLRDEGRRAEPLCCLEVTPGELPAGPELAALEAFAGKVLPLLDEDLFPAGLERLRWLRLVLPLMVQQERVGYWLCGRRDPDNDYPLDDVLMLTALANQIAAVLRVQEGLAEREKLQGQLVQSQKMEAVGRLSAGVAHDFNNFLSAILGYNELLAGLRTGDPLAREYVDGIREAGEKASALTTQLLAFSRRQARAERLVQLSPLVAQLEKLLQRVLPGDVDLSFDLTTESLVVRVDSGHLEQVLINLAVNAGDAMPDGGRLEIRTARRELPQRTVALAQMPAGTWAQLEVEDTGSGISPDLLEHIFEPFYTTKKHGEGTGLGLAMVYGIIERSHGFIEVRSQVGEGTCFTLYLPIAVGEEAEVEAPWRDPVESTNEMLLPLGSERATVLVVEDEPGVRRATAELLRNRSFNVLEAPDGLAALELCDQYEGEIQVLLTDVMMPHLQGPELADRLLMRRPNLSVIFMSGYNEEALLEYHLDKKHASLLRKPFHFRELLAALTQTLAARAPAGVGDSGSAD